jgi:hypothetical protein
MSGEVSLVMTRAAVSLLVALVLAFGPLLRALCDERCIVPVTDIVMGAPTAPQTSCHNGPSESHPGHDHPRPQSSECAHGRQVLVRGIDSAFKLVSASGAVGSIGLLNSPTSNFVPGTAMSIRLASLDDRGTLAPPVAPVPLRI